MPRKTHHLCAHQRARSFFSVSWKYDVYLHRKPTNFCPRPKISYICKPLLDGCMHHGAVNLEVIYTKATRCGQACCRPWGNGWCLRGRRSQPFSVDVRPGSVLVEKAVEVHTHFQTECCTRRAPKVNPRFRSIVHVFFLLSAMFLRHTRPKKPKQNRWQLSKLVVVYIR